jgi:hypothetical protein
MFFWPGDAVYKAVWDVAESCIYPLYLERMVGFESFGEAGWRLLVVWEAIMC